jgi:NAD(P)-dependent dehydrogenase (short-subunit alcohol dehydrogenase family)
LIADVTAENGLRNAIGEVARVYGRADIVLASAGINGVWGPIDELEPDEWDRRVNTHLRGAFLTLHFAVPHLERAGGGSEAPAEYPAGEIPLTGDKSGKAEDATELALFLASDRARHITGSPVWIDGAQSLLVG